MNETGQSRVVGLLGVGFDHKDGQIRLTQSENYEVMMGSNESHQALHGICQTIENHIKLSGHNLSDYSPEEFMELVKEIV